MEELLNAIKIRNKWNRMSITKFLEEYHKYFDKTPEETGFDSKWLERWKYCGLNNTDILNL